MTDITQMKPEMLPFENSEHCIKEICAMLAVFCAEIFQGLSVKFAQNSYINLIRGNVFFKYETVETFFAEPAHVGSTHIATGKGN